MNVGIFTFPRSRRRHQLPDDAPQWDRVAAMSTEVVEYRLSIAASHAWDDDNVEERAHGLKALAHRLATRRLVAGED